MSAGLLHVVPPSRPLPPPLSLEEAIRRSRLATAEREGRTGYIQDTLAVDFAAASDEQFFGPQRTLRDDLPDPAIWAGRIALALLEVMTGVRSAPQVLRWTTPEVYAVVARRSALVARRVAEGNAPRTRPRLRVVRVRVCEPADGVAEVSAAFRRADRVRAIAFRLQGVDGRWRITALQLG